MEEVVIQTVERINGIMGDARVPELHPVKIFPRDVWKIIIKFTKYGVSPEYRPYFVALLTRGRAYAGHNSLLSLRLTHPYFKEMLSEDPQIVARMIELSRNRLTNLLPDKSHEVECYARQILALSYAVQSCKVSCELLKKNLREHSQDLWVLRYGPGMPRDYVLDIAELIDLPLDPSPLSTLRAMRFGYRVTSKKMVRALEVAKPLILATFTALGLGSLWTSPYRVSADCFPIFITNLPSRVLWVSQNGSFRSLNMNMLLTAISGAPLLAYFGTFLVRISGPYGQARGVKSYQQLVGLHNWAQNNRITTKRRVLLGVGLCGLMVGASVGAYFLLADTYAIPWHSIQLSGYMELASGIRDKAVKGCCSMRLGYSNVIDFCEAPPFSFDPTDWNPLTDAELALPQIWARAQYIVPYDQIFLVILPMPIFVLDTLFWFVL